MEEGAFDVMKKLSGGKKNIVIVREAKGTSTTLRSDVVYLAASTRLKKMSIQVE